MTDPIWSDCYATSGLVDSAGKQARVGGVARPALAAVRIYAISKAAKKHATDAADDFYSAAPKYRTKLRLENCVAKAIDDYEFMRSDGADTSALRASLESKDLALESLRSELHEERSKNEQARKRLALLEARQERIRAGLDWRET